MLRDWIQVSFAFLTFAHSDAVVLLHFWCGVFMRTLAIAHSAIFARINLQELRLSEELRHNQFKRGIRRLGSSSSFGVVPVNISNFSQ